MRIVVLGAGAGGGYFGGRRHPTFPTSTKQDVARWMRISGRRSRPRSSRRRAARVSPLLLRRFDAVR